jgi:quinoprotein dehydrogenase-associated probable ABC transporter substrate-binding protein
MTRAAANWARRSWWAAVALLLCGIVLPAVGQEAAPARQAFRVCQDPNNLPFSNTRSEGIENRIAELFARDLGLPVVYFSFPQRLAFIRNTLRYKLPGEDFRCDIVMGVPAGFDQVSATRPYYRSTYAMVLPAGRGLDGVNSSADFLALEPAKLGKLRIGVYDRSPASDWLARHKLVEQGVPYAMLNPNPEQYPGEIIERDLVQGKIDVAIVWTHCRVLCTAHRAAQDAGGAHGLRARRQIRLSNGHGRALWRARMEAADRGAHRAAP